MTPRPVRVAVIDSGVNPSNPHVGQVAGGVAVVPGRSGDGDYLDRLGHGTAVAAAIRERAPGAELLAVKVFERELSASIDTLVAGIDWAGHHRVDLINLSLGTPNLDHVAALRAAVDRAAGAGALLVAPGCHNGVAYLPGSPRRRASRARLGLPAADGRCGVGWPGGQPGLPRVRLSANRCRAWLRSAT